MGEHNVLSIADDFDPGNETETGYGFVSKFSTALRRPPCTPTQFAEQLKKREIRAKEKGVDLFTSGKDQPFVQLFSKLCRRARWSSQSLGKFAHK